MEPGQRRGIRHCLHDQREQVNLTSPPHRPFPSKICIESVANPSFLTSLNFNIVSKRQGSDKMSYYINEAANEMRDLLVPTLEAPKSKL